MQEEPREARSMRDLMRRIRGLERTLAESSSGRTQELLQERVQQLEEEVMLLNDQCRGQWEALSSAVRSNSVAMCGPRAAHLPVTLCLMCLDIYCVVWFMIHARACVWSLMWWGCCALVSAHTLHTCVTAGGHCVCPCMDVG